MLRLQLIFKSNLLFIILLIHFSNILADENLIKIANEYVKLVDKSLGEYSVYSLSSETLSEGSPPTYKFYTKDNLLVAAIINVGHETWSNSYHYYYNNHKIVKYLKSTQGRIDNPPRKAIIYASNGKIIWKNEDAPSVSPDSVLTIFKLFTEINRKLANY